MPQVDPEFARVDGMVVREREVLRQVLEMVERAPRYGFKRKFIQTIRDRFDFREYQCRCCGEWKGPRSFDPDRKGLKTSHSYCRQCRKLVREFGSKANIPTSVLVPIPTWSKPRGRHAARLGVLCA